MRSTTILICCFASVFIHFLVMYSLIHCLFPWTQSFDVILLLFCLRLYANERPSSKCVTGQLFTYWLMPCSHKRWRGGQVIYLRILKFEMLKFRLLNGLERFPVICLILSEFVFRCPNDKKHFYWADAHGSYEFTTQCTEEQQAFNQTTEHFLQVHPETVGHSLPGLRWDSVTTAWMEDLSRLKELRGESRPVM